MNRLEFLEYVKPPKQYKVISGKGFKPGDKLRLIKKKHHHYDPYKLGDIVTVYKVFPHYKEIIGCVGYIFLDDKTHDESYCWGEVEEHFEKVREI